MQSMTNEEWMRGEGRGENSLTLFLILDSSFFLLLSLHFVFSVSSVLLMRQFLRGLRRFFRGRPKGSIQNRPSVEKSALWQHARRNELFCRWLRQRRNFA